MKLIVIVIAMCLVASAADGRPIDANGNRAQKKMRCACIPTQNVINGQLLIRV